METPPLFSSPAQLAQIAQALRNYARLPFAGETIPGAVMEALIAHVRGGDALHTYDFVDVVNRQLRCGWQIKATKEATPVTWKRAKIPNAERLIRDSLKSAAGRKALGEAIINFCNQHAAASIVDYGLECIGYARLLMRENGEVVYFERELCTAAAPQIFNAADFDWRWSKPKRTVRKEQLKALHGVHRPTGEKWFAWHGLGENQLHFSGEHHWWPKAKSPHAIAFSMPASSEKLSWKDFFSKLS
jgi:hypothetical protein